MNAERLTQHFATLENAPDAVLRLRRFILDLAVRGKLLPQDPSDEPASELLKRISEGKTQTAKTASLVEQSTVFRRSDQHPFELPGGWMWSSIGEICSKTGSGSTPRGG